MLGKYNRDSMVHRSFEQDKQEMISGAIHSEREFGEVEPHRQGFKLSAVVRVDPSEAEAEGIVWLQ